MSPHLLSSHYQIPLLSIFLAMGGEKEDNDNDGGSLNHASLNQYTPFDPVSLLTIKTTQIAASYSNSTSTVVATIAGNNPIFEASLSVFVGNRCNGIALVLAQCQSRHRHFGDGDAQ